METVAFKKRAPKQPPKKRVRATQSDDDSLSESEGEGVKKQARKNHSGIAIASSASEARSNVSVDPIQYSADRSATNQNDSGVFREAPDIDGRDRDARPIHAAVDDDAGFKRVPIRRAGPMKAPANVRAISVIDYQPDVCKDYKQTGYCGFGDTCKFLHDRGDFKQGWQLDREWEEAGKTKKSEAKHKAPLDAEAEAIPFKCVICKGDYKNPIITKCGHYFCEACAVKRYKKTASCAQCGNGTGGLFSGAKKLRELLDVRQSTPVAT